ncbi:DUF6088 family protein, partial [Streptococcus suis]
FKHASSKSLIGAGTVVGLVIQALKYIGCDGIDKMMIAKLQQTIKLEDKRTLKKNIKYVSGWMRPAIESITIE